MARTKTQPTKGKGKAYAWLVEHVSHQGDECLIWPFCTSKQDGYGHLGHMGERLYAHRVMCELIHGPAPSSDHEAAHSCGNGHVACVHPKHVFWKTKRENALDRRQHGTHAIGRAGFKLTFAEAEEIRALAGTATQREIGERFGVSARTVRDILNKRTFASETNRMPPSWTPDQDSILIRATERGLSNKETALLTGHSPAHLWRRRQILGISL